MSKETDDSRLQVETSLQRLAEAHGVSLQRQERSLVGQCPIHAGEQPTLSIDSAANTWNCSASGESGGPVEWVMKTQGVSRRHAVELLVAGNPLSTPTKRRPGRPRKSEGPSQSTVRHLASPVTAGANDRELLAQVVAYYHETLKQTPEALAYLDKRGIRTPEAIDTFKLGFSNRTLGYRLPMKNRQAGAEIRTQLQRLGVLRDTGHEHFRGSLVIPVSEEHGSVVQ